jgi:hypothetical protein
MADARPGLDWLASLSPWPEHFGLERMHRPGLEAALVAIDMQAPEQLLLSVLPEDTEHTQPAANLGRQMFHMLA